MQEFVFNPMEWFTPNTYDVNFKMPPNECGVYLIAVPLINHVERKIDYDIQYVGSTKHLSVRYKSHEVFRMIRISEPSAQFFFKQEIKYKDVEKEMIKMIQPKYNSQWR
jgi:hypothetical protein